LKNDTAPHLEIKKRKEESSPEQEEAVLEQWEQDDSAEQYGEASSLHSENVEREEDENENTTDEYEEPTGSYEEETLPHLEIKERNEESDPYDSNKHEAEHHEMAQQTEMTVEERLSEQAENIEPPAQEAAPVEEHVENEKPKENALYLTKMLSEETKPFSKLRMYFIQPGDSLTSVAEKYKLAATSLIRMNRLESDQLKPGDILYIPVK
jgi:stage VI sporulation protein D